MILSTTTDAFFGLFGYEEGVTKLSEIGFDALDMNFVKSIYDEDFNKANFEKKCERLRTIAKENGIYFNQAHSPFPSYKFLSDKEKMEEYNKKAYDAIVRSIKGASILGARNIVVHPVDVPDKTLQKEFNIEFYNSLVPVCREYNIKIALENMWGHSEVDYNKIIPNVCSYGRELAEYFDELDPRYFTVCLDIGHCGLVGEAADSAIRTLGSRLGALHVHDNDFASDMHTLPFLGKLKWERVCRALADVEYSGDFTFEVRGTYLAHYEKDHELLESAFRHMQVTGRKLISMIEEYRNNKE